jgi:ATP-binding protein involved in chromosome partitioning
MGPFECPGCHQQHAIFGEGGGKSLADEVGVPFLGTIPLSAEVRVAGDGGRPLLASETDSPAGRALREAARRLAGQVSLRARSSYAHELPVL